MRAEMDRDFPAAQWTKTAPRRGWLCWGGWSDEADCDAGAESDVDEPDSLESRLMRSTAFSAAATSLLLVDF